MMKNEIKYNNGLNEITALLPNLYNYNGNRKPLPELLFITSYPPRECGIATYSQDLINAIDNKFRNSFSIKVCALETLDEKFTYDNRVIYKLDTSISEEYPIMAEKINQNENIKLVVVQHEFGFYQLNGGNDFLNFLQKLTKPKIIVFHTVLPKPDKLFKTMVKSIAEACKSVVVMTNTSKAMLERDYGISQQKIEVIAHGTHLVSNNDKAILKQKYGFKGRKILSTFGLISSGKSIETTLDALPEIVENYPEVLFLAIGKTHPGVIKSEGEKYRQMLEEKVTFLGMEKHVRFINSYLNLPDLLEYLRLTDIYLFTSKDPNQAVSGTFSYAMSCGCPIVSTPIPQAIEMLDEHTGIIIEFENSKLLVKGVIKLLNDGLLRKEMSINTVHKIAPSAWENSAIAHTLLFLKTLKYEHPIKYSLPEIKLNHIKKMTTDFGMVQFSKINQPDIESGYTLDDNARALIALCMHYEMSANDADVSYIRTYLNFIKYCLQQEGYFLNYIDKEYNFTDQNEKTNLADASGRAIWALGYLISKKSIFPNELIAHAEGIIVQALPSMEKMHSTRAMGFAIKGLYYLNLEKKSKSISLLIKSLADRMVQMFRHEAEPGWEWYENYLTYANSVLPEALLCAWQDTGKPVYKEIAKVSFDFLLSLIFNRKGINVIPNKNWLYKGQTIYLQLSAGGEQPIDVAYTIFTLDRFYKVFNEPGYSNKMKIAFDWFLGSNHLHQIIYNPCTGGCYDGLEEYNVNLNQGAESTLSYLMARLTIAKHFNIRQNGNSVQKASIVEQMI